MVGKFTIYPVGKSATKSKQGKYNYVFLTGLKPKNDTQNKTLLDKCQPLSFWSDIDYKFEFMVAVEAVVDANGDFTQVLEILTPVPKG